MEPGVGRGVVTPIIWGGGGQLAAVKFIGVIGIMVNVKLGVVRARHGLTKMWLSDLQPGA